LEESGLPKDPGTLSDTAVGEELGLLASLFAVFCIGAIHLVQMMEVGVLRIVETAVVTCKVGVPLEVIVLVTGQRVIVV
jgi:hypothetical protein